MIKNRYLWLVKSVPVRVTRKGEDVLAYLIKQKSSCLPGGTESEESMEEERFEEEESKLEVEGFDWFNSVVEGLRDRPVEPQIM